MLCWLGNQAEYQKFKKFVQEFFDDKELSKNINPDEVVAFGATIQAAILNNNYFLFELMIQDVTPLSLGTSIIKGDNSSDFKEKILRVVKRNTPIPLKKTQNFFTSMNNQTCIRFTVLQGEHSIASKNHVLGEFLLEGIKPLPARSQSFSETFEMDADVILTVTAVDTVMDSQNSITFTQTNQHLSTVEIERMIKYAVKYQKDDKKCKEFLQIKQKLEDDCIHIKNELMAEEIDDEKKLVLEVCQSTLDWVEENPNAPRRGIRTFHEINQKFMGEIKR